MPRPRLDSLLEYVTAEDRVCPLPTAWDKLHRLLGPRSPPPLILAAWGSPEWAKARRLKEQIHVAAEMGELPRVDRFLRRLRVRDSSDGPPERVGDRADARA